MASWDDDKSNALRKIRRKHRAESVIGMAKAGFAIGDEAIVLNPSKGSSSNGVFMTARRGAAGKWVSAYGPRLGPGTRDRICLGQYWGGANSKSVDCTPVDRSHAHYGCLFHAYVNDLRKV